MSVDIFRQKYTRPDAPRNSGNTVGMTCRCSPTTRPPPGLSPPAHSLTTSPPESLVSSVPLLLSASPLAIHFLFLSHLSFFIFHNQIFLFLMFSCKSKRFSLFPPRLLFPSLLSALLPLIFLQSPILFSPLPSLHVYTPQYYAFRLPQLHSHSRPDRMAIRRPATATLLMTIPLILSPFLLIPRILVRPTTSEYQDIQKEVTDSFLFQNTLQETSPPAEGRKEAEVTLREERSVSRIPLHRHLSPLPLQAPLHHYHAFLHLDNAAPTSSQYFMARPSAYSPAAFRFPQHRVTHHALHPTHRRLQEGKGDVHEEQGVPQEVLQLLPSAVKGVYSHYSHVHTAAQPTTTIPPPVVWFPDLNKECGDGGGGGDGGFSTFSFLAMVVSVVNLISLLHSTANNNNNNNNNNDDNNNVNSANMQAANEDNNNNNLGVLTMVMFGGRRRRDLYSSSSSSSSSEDVAAAVGLFFLKAWLQVFGFNSTFTLLHNPTTSFPSTSTLLAPGGVVGRTSGCALLALCEANERSAAFGQLGEDVAEVLSVAFVDHLQEAIVEVKGERERAGLLRAGGRGRTCWRSACCAFHYPCGNS
ncbi:uncharacterized protein LOC123500048 [Portunus trituberculatus]|uniref:uncharacterized protein LOC123500048 n=1 Tax=Portunus trituberculatus TaxID=210409 RepID=UPI001E1CC539|nr:uncharacterized protein LOC123500048 [Portunus trituberculatus]